MFLEGINVNKKAVDIRPAASTASRISYELMAPDLSRSNSLKVTWKIKRQKCE